MAWIIPVKRLWRVRHGCLWQFQLQFNPFYSSQSLFGKDEPEVKDVVDGGCSVLTVCEASALIQRGFKLGACPPPPTWTQIIRESFLPNRGGGGAVLIHSKWQCIPLPRIFQSGVIVERFLRFQKPSAHVRCSSAACWCASSLDSQRRAANAATFYCEFPAMTDGGRTEKLMENSLPTHLSHSRQRHRGEGGGGRKQQLMAITEWLSVR